jgi:hypothetical protein
MAKHTIYTAEAIEKIRTMRAAGKTGVQIARVIGTTPGSLGARLSQLGIATKQRKPIPDEVAA